MLMIQAGYKSSIVLRVDLQLDWNQLSLEFPWFPNNFATNVPWSKWYTQIGQLEKHH